MAPSPSSFVFSFIHRTCFENYLTPATQVPSSSTTAPSQNGDTRGRPKRVARNPHPPQPIPRSFFSLCGQLGINLPGAGGGYYSEKMRQSRIIVSSVTLSAHRLFLRVPAFSERPSEPLLRSCLWWLPLFFSSLRHCHCVCRAMPFSCGYIATRLWAIPAIWSSAIVVKVIIAYEYNS